MTSELAFWLEQGARYVSLALTVVVIFRLSSLKLISRYPGFFAYTAVSLLRGLVLAPFSPSTTTFALIYMFSLPVMWWSYMVVTFEIFSRVLAAYKGISLFSRATISLILAVSIGVSLAGTAPQWQNRNDHYPVLLSMFLVENVVLQAVFVFLLAIAMLMLYFPIPLGRNLIVYSLGMGALFFMHASAIWIRNLGGGSLLYTRIGSVSALLLQVGVLATWATALSRAGEQTSGGIALGRAPETQKRLLEQLNSLNATLEGIAKKA